MNDETQFCINGREVTPTNAVLYTFVGAMASRNHIWMMGDDSHPNTYTFAYGNEDNFADLAHFMVDNGNTCHLNLREISRTDEKAYQDFCDWFTKQAMKNIDTEIEYIEGEDV